MIAAAWIIGSIGFVTVYSWIGRSFARRRIGGNWGPARSRWRTERYARKEVQGKYIADVWFWPIKMLFGTVDLSDYDSQVIARREREQEARIRELEEELGMK